jgi:hypothetical protein
MEEGACAEWGSAAAGATAAGRASARLPAAAAPAAKIGAANEICAARRVQCRCTTRRRRWLLLLPVLPLGGVGPAARAAGS